MPDCDAVRENMPMLLTESLDPARRELTHQHIETCPLCVAEWMAYQETWQILDTLRLRLRVGGGCWRLWRGTRRASGA